MVHKKSVQRVVALSLLLLTSAVSCLPRQGLDRVAASYGQDILRYHVDALTQRGRRGVQSWPEARPQTSQELGLVEEYFTLTGQIKRLEREVGTPNSQDSQTLAALGEQLEWAGHRRDLLKARVEAVLSRQVGESLRQAGLTASLGPRGPTWFFPPSQFLMLKPPFILVTSPRERIEIAHSYLLAPWLPLSTLEAIERQTEASGVSALVEETGGFSLYPPWVSEDASLRYTLDTVAHEWAHAYLFLFYPLGRAYFLDYRMQSINETVANIIGQEMGEEVYRRYYATGEPPTPSPAEKEWEGDFATEMRRIRAAVDQMLGQGQVDEAEAYMEAQRVQLVARGYYLRRLNQAYFAFHGAYADEPAFEGPIGTALKELRARSPSLGDFVRRVGSVSSYGDFQKLLP